MPASICSVETDEGSDDESGLRHRSSSCESPRWSRMTEGTKGWRLRGVEWRVKLGILPAGGTTVDAMRRATADGRRRYADLRRRLLVDPHIMDDDQSPSHQSIDNPLSQDPESIWGRYFRNAELEKTIDKDLTRLYPEHGLFFQSTPCQAMMRRILLVWSLLHPQFSYRQGMHELLGPLLYVLHVDVVRLSQVKHRFEDLFDDRFDSLSLQEQHVRDKVELAKNFCGEMVVAGDSINFNEKVNSTDIAVDTEEQRVDLSVIVQGSDMYGVEGELGALLSARFLEHDAYCMLDALLVGQGGAVAMANFFTSSVGGGNPPVIEACAALYRTLAAADITLYTHLVDLGVEPQFFALRWLRVLFGREFLLDDLVRVWDAILEADNTSEREENSEMKFSARSAIIFSISVSMLLYVRPALLAAPDATACLQRLLNFPQVPNVRNLIESAKSLQPLAQVAARAPVLPVPRNTRSSEGGRVTGKKNSGSGTHSRSGSISPPVPHHLVLFQNSSCPSPEGLRVSMSLPGSYWEEKWTLSVLHNKTPDELCSPTTLRIEEVPRVFENADREGSVVTGTLSRCGSESRYLGPELVASSFGSSRAYDSSPDSGDEDGQEMSRRDGQGLSQRACITKDSSSEIQPRKTITRGGPSVSNENEVAGLDLGNGRREVSGLHIGEGSTVAFSTERQGPSRVAHYSGEEVTSASGEVDVKIPDRGGDNENHLLITKGDDAGSNKLVDSDANSVSQNDGTIPQELDTSEFSFAIQPQLDTGEPATPGLSTGSSSETLGLSSGLQSDPITDPQPNVNTAAESISDANVEVSCGDVKSDAVPSSESSDEKDGEEKEKASSSSDKKSFVPSKSKPPLAPTKLGRFNWVWSLGRTSVAEKTVTNKVFKEDSSDNSDPTPSLSGLVSDADASTSVATAVAAQRRKKSWWRSNSDVVPEDTMSSNSSDSSSSSAVDTSDNNVIGQSDLVKLCSEQAATIVPSEVQVNEEMVEETPPIVLQEAAKKPKEISPSAALQALGQSVLDHVQVIEAALAQKVSDLGIDNILWTPAGREKSDSTDKACLGSKGQSAAVAAIAELRKISQALQQM